MSFTFVSWPCRRNNDPDRTIEQCEPYEAEFWGIYRRQADGRYWGPATWVVDVEDENDAITVTEILNRFSRESEMRLGSPQPRASSR